MVDNEDNGKVGESEDTGEGDKPEETKIIEQQSKRIKELEDERHKRIMDDAQKQMGGTTEGGKPAEEKKELTHAEASKEYIDKNFAKFK